jgi:excinuclease UvrABC nuclease subunit
MNQEEAVIKGGHERGKLERFKERAEVFKRLANDQSIVEVQTFCKENGLDISQSALIQQRDKLIGRKKEIKEELITQLARDDLNFSKDIQEVIKKLIGALKDAPSDLLIPQTTKEASNLASAISNLGKYDLELSGKGTGDKTLILNVIQEKNKSQE